MAESTVVYIPAANPTGSGTAGQVAYWSSAGAVTSSSGLTYTTALGTGIIASDAVDTNTYVLTLTHQNASGAGHASTMATGILLRGEATAAGGGGDIDYVGLVGTATTNTVAGATTTLAVQTRTGGGALETVATFGAGATGGVTLLGRVTSGSLTITQTQSLSGVPTAGLLFTGAAHLSITAATEAIDVNFATGRTVQWSNGTVTTQRSVVFGAPAWQNISSPGVFTNAVSVDIAGNPITSGSGGNVSNFTNLSTLRVGLTGLVGATTAGWNATAIRIPAGTLTVTGSTQVTATCAGSMINLGILTLTDSSAVTIDAAATLYIAGAPLAAGSVTLTSTYAIWVDAGLSRFDGNGTAIWEVPADGTAGVDATIDGRIPIRAGGATKYIRYYAD